MRAPSEEDERGADHSADEEDCRSGDAEPQLATSRRNDVFAASADSGRGSRRREHL
jgi:hypothetical protein